MILLGGAWAFLGFMNYVKFLIDGPPGNLKEFAADLFIILPLNLMFGGIILLTSILK